MRMLRSKGCRRTRQRRFRRRRRLYVAQSLRVVRRGPFPLPGDGPEKHAKREWRQSLRNTDVSRRVVHFSDCRTLLSMSDTSIDVAASRPLAFTPPTLPTPMPLPRRASPTSSMKTCFFSLTMTRNGTREGNDGLESNRRTLHQGNTALTDPDSETV